MAGVKTFLYAVGDDRMDEVKFGYLTDVSFAKARKHVTSRYRSVFRHFVLHQLVPVAVHGRDAENQLKERLKDYHVRNELLAFPDRLSMHWLLSSTYKDLACPEEQAFKQSTSSAVRIGAEAAASRRERRRAEAAALQEKRRRNDEAWLAEQAERTAAEMTVLEACRRRKRTDQENKLASAFDVMAWVRAHYTTASDDEWVTLASVQKALKAAGGQLGPRKLKSMLELVWAPRIFKKHHTVSGIRHATAIVGIRQVQS